MADLHGVGCRQETDAAGNTGTSTRTFTLDTLAPVVTESLASETCNVVDRQDHVQRRQTGAGDANAVVHVHGRRQRHRRHRDRRRRRAPGRFTPAGLVNGAHTIVASETDAAGNAGTTSLTFTLDTTAPADHRAPGQRYRVVVDRQDHVERHADRQRATPTRWCTFTVDGSRHRSAPRPPSDRASGPSRRPALRDGPHTIVASETDAAGNTGSAALAFTLDTTAPAVTDAPGQRHRIVVDRQDHVRPHPDRRRRRQRRRSLHGRRQRHRRHRYRRRVRHLDASHRPASSTARTPSSPARPTPPATRAALARLHARQHRGRHHRAPGQRHRIVVDRQDHVGPHPDRLRRRQRRRSLHSEDSREMLLRRVQQD